MKLFKLPLLIFLAQYSLFILFVINAIFLLFVIRLNAELELNISLEIYLIFITVFSGLYVLFFERVLPYQHKWNKNNNDLVFDLQSAFVLSLLDPTCKILFALMILQIPIISDWVNPLNNFPAIIQLGLITLLAEFGKYWSHRLHHTNIFFWQLHKMHHASRRIYMLNALRVHPINYFINIFFSIFPLILLGFSDQLIILYLIITQPIVIFQHANIQTKNGWLNFIFSTNEIHRLHHSTIQEIANNNYGSAILLWDQFFGTFKKPLEINKVGLFKNNQSKLLARTYWKQVFSLRCC